MTRLNGLGSLGFTLASMTSSVLRRLVLWLALPAVWLVASSAVHAQRGVPYVASNP